MAQRLVRAKGKIRDARIPYQVPNDADFRLGSAAVLAVVYLIFNEGYAASSGDRLVRDDLCAEAIRLGRLLVELVPEEPEVTGLLALMLLLESRRAARTTADGGLVRLADQDRASWDRRLIAEGQAIVRQCLQRNRARPVPDPGGDQRRAQRRAHRGRHGVVADRAALRSAPRARAEPDRGPQPRGRGGRGRGARPRRSRSSTELDLDSYHLFHAIRADLLRRLGRNAEAALAYEAALARTENAAERELLERRRSSTG